jgi:hypothetical protein
LSTQNTTVHLISTEKAPAIDAQKQTYC